MNKNQYIEITGIKCDTPHCNYRDDNVQFEDFPKWINKRCPVCGRNLLTQQEYDKCIKLYDTFEKIEKWAHKLRWFNPMFYYNRLTGRKSPVYEITYKFPKRRV